MGEGGKDLDHDGKGTFFIESDEELLSMID